MSWIDFLKNTMPLLVVSLAIMGIVFFFLHHAEKRLSWQTKQTLAPSFLPMRVAAYERLILFLERTIPDSLLIRVQEPTMTVLELQTTLLSAIRMEYEHNLAQQLYVSDDAFLLVKNAKESLVQLINIAASNFSPTEKGLYLSTRVFEMYHSSENTTTPTDLAIKFLKQEFRAIY